MNKKLIVVLLLMFLFFSSSIFAETIVLKSGKTVDGKLLGKTDKDIKVDILGVPVTYYLAEIESIDGIKVNIKASQTESSRKDSSLSSNELKIIPKSDISSSLSSKNNNALLHYKSGKVIEAKITRRLKDEVLIEGTAGVEIGIGIKEIDYIETSIPNILTNFYVNAKYGITMQGPKDWVMVIPEGYYLEMLKWSDSQLVYFHKYPIEDMRLTGQVDPFISIVIDDNHPGIYSGLDYALQRVEVLKNAMPDLNVLSTPSEVTLKGEKWVKLEIESRNSNIRQENYFLLKNDLIYWVSFGAPPDSFASEIKIFKEAFNNIEIR